MSDHVLTSSTLPVIAIVGRANVGKSTLWNKIIGRKRAIVSDVAHTTRDRNIDVGIWRGREFRIVDTGGFDTEDTDIGLGIRRQVDEAVKRADVIIFVVDGRVGVLEQDRSFVKELKRVRHRVVLTANKIEKAKDEASLANGGVYALGFGDPILISAVTGKGVGDLLDAAYEKLPKERKEDETTTQKKPEQEEAVRIVLMGRTNVGKSSLTNAILGEERVIVSNIPHTTREPQDTHFTYKGERLVLVDTAGMRRRSGLRTKIDEEALEKNREALKRADIAFLIIDATEDPKMQDKELAGLMKEESKGLILVLNKWDLVESKSTRSAKQYETNLRTIFPFLAWAPIMLVSAKTKKRAKDLLDLALRIQSERHRTIDYNALNRLLKSVIKMKRPLQTLGPQSPYVHDIAQVGSAPPRFMVTVRGKKQTVHPSWLKFLERKIREKFGFEGTPIVVQSSNVPVSKAERPWNLHGPGMDSVPDTETKKRKRRN